MSDFSSQYDSPTLIQLKREQAEKAKQLETNALDTDADISSDNLNNQVQTQNGRQVNNQGGPVPEVNWNLWNFARTTDGKNKLASSEPQTIAQKKAESLAQIQRIKALKLAGTSEEAEQHRANAASVSTYNRLQGIADANVNSVFDTSSVVGAAGDVALRAAKSFTDIVDDTLIDKGMINSTGQQNSAYYRQLDNETQRTSAKLQDAQEEYGQGNEVSGAWKAMGAIVEMGGIMGGSLWNNPSEVLDMLADSASFFVGGTGIAGQAFGAARDVSYALRVAKQGVLDYEQANGEAPTGDALGRILVAAGASGILARASATVLQGQGGVILKRPVNAVMDATANATKAAVQKTLSGVAARRVANGLIDVGRVAGTVGRDAVIEGSQEVAQEYLETNFAQDKDLEADDVRRLAEAGVSGAAMGGVMGVPRGTVEAVKSYSAASKNNSALDLQDAKVNALLKRSKKGEGSLTPESRQALYAEAKTEQAKADSQAEAVTAQTTKLEAKLRQYTSPATPRDEEEANNIREESATLTTEIKQIKEQIAKESTLEDPSVNIAGMGNVSIATATYALEQLESKLAGLPTPAAEVTPELRKEQQMIAMLSPSDREKAITVLTNAISKNTNSLKQYERTRAAAESLTSQFNITEDQRIEEDKVAAVKVAERKTAKEEEAAYALAKAEAVAKGEPEPKYNFKPSVTDSASIYANTAQATEQEEKTLKTEIGSDSVQTVRPADAVVPSWDSRMPAESTNQAIARLLREYENLPEGQTTAATAVLGKLLNMVDADNPAAINAFRNGKDFIAAANATYAKLEHYSTGNDKNVATAADYEAVLDNAPDSVKPQLAKGIYNSIAQKPDNAFSDYMANVSPEHLQKLGANLSPEALEHLLTQGILHKDIADKLKTKESVNIEIVKTGFDGKGDTGEKMSVTQHDKAIQQALADGNQEAARAAFINFAAWASEHIERREKWIGILKDKGYADRQAEKGKMTAAERKLFPYASSSDFYETLVAEDAIFRTALASGYAALEDKAGLTEWWVNSLESNHADDAHIRNANSKSKVASYDIRDAVKPADDADIKWDKRSAGQKAHIRGFRNLLRYFGKFRANNKMLDIFSSENNLIARSLTPNLDIKNVKGITLHGDNSNMSNEQAASWSSFLDFHGLFTESWDKTIKAGTNNKDLISNFYASNGKDMDPNIRSILAAVAYDFIATQGVSTLHTTADDMDKMFNTKYSGISVVDRAKLLTAIQGKGIPRTALMRELGLAAMRNTGIKFEHEGAPSKTDLAMATAFGHAMLDTLVASGVIKQTSLHKKDHPGFSKAIKSPTIALVAIDSFEGKPVQVIANSISTYKKEGNILDMLGSDFSRAKIAYIDIADMPVHEYTVDGKVRLSTEQNGEPGTKEAIAAMNSVPRQYKSKWLALMTNISLPTLKSLDGFVTGTGNINIGERINVQSANNQIESNLDDATEHAALVSSKPWYVNHTVVSNMRTNIEGYGDYQKNKWIRMAMQNVTPVGNIIDKNNPDHMETLHASLTTYMKGSKSHRMLAGNAVPELTMQTATPAMRAQLVNDAIEYLEAADVFSLLTIAETTPLSSEQEADLVKALQLFESEFDTEKGAELLETVLGLQELQAGMASTKDTFETTFSGEADGTSNGVFFTLMQMGVFDTVEQAAAQMKRYGLTIKGFTGTVADIFKDIYQYIGAEREKSRKQAVTLEKDATADDIAYNEIRRKAQVAMDSFIGAADARNTNKPHTMTTIYSMAIQGQFAEIAKLLQQKVTSELTAVANISDEVSRETALDNLAVRMNDILKAMHTKPYEFKPVATHKLFTGISENRASWTSKQLLETSVASNYANIMELYAKTVEGPHLQVALETVFGKFTEKSGALNSIANSIFEVSEKAKAMFTTDALKRARAAEDITDAEMEQKLLPTKYVNEVEAKLKERNLASHMPSAQSVAGEYDTYIQLGSTDITINHKLNHIQGDGSTEKREAIHALDKENIGPGAGTGAIATHSLDALGMLKRMATGMLGIHDALVGPALELAAQSKEYNKFYMQALLNYSHLNAASMQLDSMLSDIELLSAEFNELTDSEASRAEMVEVYKAVLTGAYKSEKAAIANMDYQMLRKATNSYRVQLRAAVARQKHIAKEIMSAAPSLNQMSMSEHTQYDVPSAVKDLAEIVNAEIASYSELAVLDTTGNNEKGSIQAVVVQKTLGILMDNTNRKLRSNAVDSKGSPVVLTPEEEANYELEIQWIADVSKELNKVISPNYVVNEIRKNGDYSSAENIDRVLKSAFNQATVLLAPERAQQIINEVQVAVLDSIADMDSASYQTLANSIDANEDTELQRASVNARLLALSDAHLAAIVEAKAEVTALNTIKTVSKVKVKETYSTTGAMRIFADLLTGVTNETNLGDMFKLGMDLDKNDDLSSMAKSMNGAARNGLPAHTRKAIEIIAASGSKLFVQVGGKEYKTETGPIERNVTPELAYLPFIISGDTIQIAPPSFTHSPFNSAANMTRLAAALELDTLARGDNALDNPKLKLPLLDIALMAGLSEVPTTNVTGWLREIMRKYLTDSEYAKTYSTQAAVNARNALGPIAKAMGVSFNINKLGANIEVISSEVVWPTEEIAVEPSITDAEVKSLANTNLAKGTYNSLSDGEIEMTDQFAVIESADIASTLTMLGDTYGAEPEEHAAHLTKLMGTMSKAIDKISLGIVNVTGSVQQGIYDNGRIVLNVFKAKDSAATSKLVASGVVQGAQEIYAHEITHAATGFALDNSPALYNEANALWQEIRDAENADGTPLFDYTLFMPEGMDANSGKREDVEMANHVKRYMFDHIFEIKNGPDGKSKHVAEFIAYGNTNARFREALLKYEQNVASSSMPDAKTGFLDKLANVFNKVVDFITRKSDTSDETLLRRFDALTARLAANDAQHKGALMHAADYAANGAGKVFAAATTAVSMTLDVMGKAMTYVPIDGVQNTGKLVRMAAVGNIEGIKDGLDKAYDHFNKANHNWLGSIVSEQLGRRKYELTTRRDIRRITAASDAMRQNIQDSIASAINTSFTKPLQSWDMQDQRVMTNVLLRTDLSALAYTNNNINSLNIDLVSDLLSDSTMVDAKIASLTAELLGNQNTTKTQQAFYVRNARALGAFMATGKVVDDLLLNNATAIALEHGTSNAISPTKANIANLRREISITDQLASLYALRFTDANAKSRAAEIITAEPQGVAMLMSAHFANKVDSAEMQFKDAPTLLLKGYLPDDTAKNVELKLAPTKDEELYIKQGWKVNAPLIRDKADNVNSDMQYYTRRTIGETYNKGGFDLTTMSARGITGTKISTMSPEQAAALGVKNQQAIAQRSVTVKRMYRPLGNDSLTDMDILSGNIPNRMAPTLDAYGNVTEYRYLVPNVIKDSTLMREVNPANVLAKAHGQTKQRSGLVETTTPLVRTLKQVYDNLSEAKKNTTVEISVKSTDPRGQEAYRMLPQYIKDAVRDVWGSDAMHVPAAMMDPVFGNRSLSIESWLRDPKVAKGLADTTHEILKHVFGPNAAYGAGYVQETIQSLVSQAKSAIIVKSPAVLYANVLSNSAILVGMGMKPSDVTHYYREAIPETRRYQQDTEEAFAIDMKISAMSHGERFTRGSELQQRRAQLTDSLARNPMHDLMEAGAYVNIATQLGVSTSRIQDDPKWIEQIKNARGQYLSDTVNKVIDEALLTEDSKLYKAAVVGAQMSDFAARYALVRHLTTNGVKDSSNGTIKRYTSADAIDVAMDVFVDFMGATSPELQIANDFGFVMFSKYRLRVMNAMMAAADINPKGTLGLSMLDMASKAAGVAGGITASTGSMGLTGLTNSINNPLDVISRIADNTLFSYVK